MERWRKPALIYDVEPDGQRIMITGNGRAFSEVKLIVDAETNERFREGRICVNCLEPQEEASPLHCPLCGFEIRANQQEWISANFLGHEFIGSKVKISDELARLRGE